MTAGPWTFTDAARTKLADDTFSWTGSAWKCALVLSTSNIGASSTTWAGVTNEHAAQYGYATGGVDIEFALSGSPDVDIEFVSPPYWLASGGSIVARRAVIYKVGSYVLAYCLLNGTNVDVTTTSGSVLLLSGIPFNLG